MRDVLRDDAPSPATIHRWLAEFQRGRLPTEDERRSGRPVETSTTVIGTNCQKVK